MPRKIAFNVISWTGHEENYSAKELMIHAPTVSGWRSSRFCSYPQEIVLQMVERCRIRKLQLLAHQYLISAKIEFHIGDTLPEPGSPKHQQFCRLGYVSLSDNEKTGFRARELKSVHVDAVGIYLKLTFHKNHVNQYNAYNQVALVAINILGDPVDFSNSPITSRDHLIDQYLRSTQHSSALDGSYGGCKSESISPLDDLAFDMYQDPEIARIIRLLDDKKQDMVRLERFDLAKKLKQAIADLQKVGERLGRYDVEKQSAIDREDYDTAKQKKEQMESYRLRVYQELELHDLLNMEQIHRVMEGLSDFGAPAIKPLKTIHPSKSSEKKEQEQYLLEEEQITPKPTSPLRTSVKTSRTPPHVPTTDVTSLLHDEKPLPAVRKKTGEHPQPQPEATSPPLDQKTPRNNEVTGEPEPLKDKVQREASLPIEVFGDSLVAGAYSKTWSYRENALLAAYKKLAEVPSGTSKAELRNMMRATVFLCKKALTDKVSSVFQASLRLLRMILKEFVSTHQLGRSEISYCVEQTLPGLLSRTGESSRILWTLAIDFIQEMAMCKEVRPLHLVPTELVKPIKGSMPVRLALSRLELLEKLLEKLGTKDSGFTLDNVMRFLAGALQHSAGSVREVAARIVQAMYRLHRNSILTYLPSDDATRKNVLYKNLFDSFAKIDGTLPDPQFLTKRSTPKEGEREKEEIRSLQEQLAVLRDISEKGKEKNKSPEKKTEKPPKTAVEKGNDSISNYAKGTQSAVANYLDNLCIFCGEKDKSFTEEGLDLHYWKHCPMLCRCLYCRQVVEIASLTEHLLSECDHRASFTQCLHCSEAIIKEELTEHSQSSSCNPFLASGSCNHCPLCHENFPPGEEGWKFHLMDSNAGCKQNTRRTVSLQRPQAYTQGKTVSTAMSKPTAAAVSVSKGRGGGMAGSRTQAPAQRPGRTTRIRPGKTSNHRPVQA